MGALAGRVALVTGASRGIGRAIARRFSAEGAAVVLNASRIGRHGNLAGTLEEAVCEIPAAGGKAAAVGPTWPTPGADGPDRACAGEAFGPIDVLVNNAAGAKMRLPSESTTEERRFMFDLNVNAPVDLAQQAIPEMKARGCGWNLNTTSATSTQPTVPYRDPKLAALIIGPKGGASGRLAPRAVAPANLRHPTALPMRAAPCCCTNRTGRRRFRQDGGPGRSTLR